MLLDDIRIKKDAIVALGNQYGAKHIRVFGSVARYEDKPGSDIDFLVEFPRGYDLFNQRLPLTKRLASLLKRHVDLVPEHEPKPTHSRSGTERSSGAMNKPWQPYARHILDTIAKIQRIQIKGDLTLDEILYDAALRNLQTMSEATQLLPEEKKKAFPDIPWSEISGFRNILVHSYLGDIDPVTVQSVINNHLGLLEDCINSMLSDDESVD